MSPIPIPDHRRPPGVRDDTVAAVGKLSEAFETIEHARGHLYAFHRLTGRAELTLGEAIEQLRGAGHGQLADELAAELQGRNVLAGRWTFQVVEEFDDGYYDGFRRAERRARDQLVGGVRHLYEAEMKARTITPGRAGHEPAP